LSVLTELLDAERAHPDRGGVERWHAMTETQRLFEHEWSRRVRAAAKQMLEEEPTLTDVEQAELWACTRDAAHPFRSPRRATTASE
jgi:hypothetical protein